MSRFIPNSFQIPNAVIDEFLSKLSGNAFKCYALIARQTTGWQKQSDRISISQFMDKCGIKDRKTAFSCLTELEGFLLIKTFKYKGEITEFSLNFEFDDVDSEPVPKNGTSTKNSFEPVPKNGTGGSTKNWHSTKNTIKNNITNTTSQPTATSRKQPKFSDDDLKTAHWIFDLLQKLNPNIKHPNFEQWANEIRLLREVDKRTHREICELFRWANQDSFWRANILSPRKLREKWDQLTIKKSQGGSRVSGRSFSEMNAAPWNTEEAWRETF